MKKRVNSDPQGRVKVAKSLRLQGRAAWMTNLGAYPVCHCLSEREGGGGVGWRRDLHNAPNHV